ncbi:hypothetical protein MED217_13374 [Leeuwenhoekiella blandensis MED217]|uniref:Uncharacterized protein n=1 Tax=Leeuwenhoekiella blandensis (strain CECT 7118 / CCUG 51940 / KCTC 22103 / MED217) TaxID=398720 RepID=A3XPM1_LEEBM|nr:hypothetical protein MED217_13374 [Leeuwenhoekiella blandensis MED217]
MRFIHYKLFESVLFKIIALHNRCSTRILNFKTFYTCLLFNENDLDIVFTKTFYFCKSKRFSLNQKLNVEA